MPETKYALWHDPSVKEPVIIVVIEPLLGGSMYLIEVNGEARVNVPAAQLEFIGEPEL